MVSYQQFTQVSCKVFVEDDTHPGKVWMRRSTAKDDGRAWWEVPGGRIDEGDQPEATARREIQEELGVNVKGDELHLFYAEGAVGRHSIWRQPTLFLFYVAKASETPANFEDEEDWCTAEYEPVTLEALAQPDFFDNEIFREAAQRYLALRTKV